jgi:hypothetical protein
MNDERMLFKNNHSRRSLKIAVNLVTIFIMLLFTYQIYHALV